MQVDNNSFGCSDSRPISSKLKQHFKSHWGDDILKLATDRHKFKISYLTIEMNCILPHVKLFSSRIDNEFRPFRNIKLGNIWCRCAKPVNFLLGASIEGSHLATIEGSHRAKLSRNRQLATSVKGRFDARSAKNNV